MSDEQTTYQRLAAQFPVEAHKKVNKGGRDQTYVPWTDKVERLNEVLGSDWSFRIVREGLTDTEAWVLGEITATIDGVVTVRQQYGCEPIARGQSARPTTDLFKIAGTDALSKAATLLGCGLYLSIQEERAEVEAAMQEAVRAAAESKRAASAGNARASGQPPTPSSETGGSSAEDAPICEECGESLTETRFKDGTNWPAAQLAVFGRRKFSKILAHYREHNTAKRRAEEALQQVPF
jgi:hypothetical protein